MGEPLRQDIVVRLAKYAQPQFKPASNAMVAAPAPKPQPTPPAVRMIKEIVCEETGLTLTELVSQRRSRHVSWPRFIAMDVARKYTTLSYPRIGHLFGGMDHASVMHGILRCRQMTDPSHQRHNPAFIALYRKIEARCAAALALSEEGAAA